MINNDNSKKSRLNEFINAPQKSLWKLAIPMMFGMMVQAIYMLTDTAFIGNWVGADGLAALGYVFPYMFIIMGFTFGLGAGVTAVIAKYIGENKKESADEAARQTLIIGFLLAIIIILITFIFKDNIFTIQNAEGSSVKYAMDYFKILSMGSIFMILSMFVRAILSGEGDNIFPMKVLGFGTVLNIILDPIFIYYVGIKGAAIATVLSQFTVCLIFFYYIGLKGYSYLNISMDNIHLNKKIINQILKVGIPSSLSMVIMALGSFIFNIILNSPNAVAAFQTAGRVEHLFFLPIISISSSMVTLVGMFYGARRFDLMKMIVKYSLKTVVLFSILSMLMFYSSAKYIVPLFTDSLEITSIAIKYFSIVCFSYPFVSIGMTSSRVMQGLGHGKPMLVITLIRVVLINAPMGYVITRILELPIDYVWYSILVSSFVASSISILWMKAIVRLEQNKIVPVT